MSGSVPTLAVSLLALALAMTALWLVTDMVKRMVTEAKALVDASTRALWRQHATTEKTVKAAVDNQRSMADEIARLRQKLDERERRERDLAGRFAALNGELERQTARILALMDAEQARQSVPPARPSATRAQSAPSNATVATPFARTAADAAPTSAEGGGLARWLGDIDEGKAMPAQPAAARAKPPAAGLAPR